MSANILNGKEIAQDIFEEVYLKVSELNKSGWQPMLLSIKVGENPAVDLYTVSYTHLTLPTNREV